MDVQNSERHPTTGTWAFPPAARARLPGGLERTNLLELMARPHRYEHHLLVCATVGDVQLEVATASEPLYFGHINLSDEYSLALPTGDDLIDRFPMRTFLSDPVTGEDVGRYNHHAGDLVLHPEGLLHWPGRLRAPWKRFDFPSGMRRCGLTLVYCASISTLPTASPVTPPAGRDGDAKAYVVPPPPMILASMRGPAGVLARIGRTTLTLVERPETVSPAHGGWVVILDADADGPHFSCDLIRIPKGAALDGAGIVRALLLASDSVAPDLAPPGWRGAAVPPFAPFEEREPGVMPIAIGGSSPVETNTENAGALRIEALSPEVATITLGDTKAEVPRYWLARMLYRVALHGLRLGYTETYGGFFVDDRGEGVAIGLRAATGARRQVRVPRGEAMATLERIYRAAAPPGYTERPT